jgi:site-specific recombinase XerD
MFERIFHRNFYVARHYAGPYSEERQLYLSTLIVEGRSKITMKHVAELLLTIARYLPIDRKGVTKAQIERSAERWISSRRHQHGSERSRRLAKTSFIFHAASWLRLLGHFRQRESQRRFPSELDAFLRFQRDERGLASSTISRRQNYVSRFLGSLMPRTKALKQIAPEDISRYFTSVPVRGWERGTIALHVEALRAFFRFAESKKWCAVGLASTIDAPRVYRNERLPRGPRWSDVQRLITGLPLRTATDIRDHAILLLFAVYGFRNSEVRLLRIEDLDWDRETIHISRTKQRKSQIYPLVREVGSAILRYLREVRPHTERREVFLALRQPYRPLTAGGMYSMVRNRQQEIGLTLPRYGPHSLRHACATHLLDEGFSLKEIGDHLGHMSTDATQIYAKVDLTALRQVAQMDLHELVIHTDASLQACSSAFPISELVASRSTVGFNQGGLR